MSFGIARVRYSTSGFRKVIPADFTPHFALATVAQGAFGDLYTRTEETASTTTDISTGASAANIIDGYEFGGFQAGSSMADRTEAILFDEVEGLIEVVEYTGDGVDPQPIGGIGFLPDVVLAMEAGTGKIFIKTSDHVGDNCRDLSVDAGSNNADAIDSLDPDGFTVASSTNLNNSGTKYIALCMKETGGSSASISLVNGMGISLVSYTGDGTDPTAITGVGFRPDAVMIVRYGDATAQTSGWKTASMPDQASLIINTGIKESTNGIDSLDADGFTVGGTTGWNTNTITYSAICLKAGLVADLA